MPNISLHIKNLLFQSRLHPHSDLLGKSRHVAILRYHALLDSGRNDYVSPNISLPVDTFEAQIRYLARNYTVISMDEVAECYYNHKPFPKRAVAITFDDGYRDNFRAYQILKKYGVSGTFYVVAGCIGGGEALWLFEIIFLIHNTARKKVNIYLHDRSETLPIGSDYEKLMSIRAITALIKSNNRAFREGLREQLRDQLSDVTGLEKRAAKIMLSWEQLREMDRAGMIIGGHTMTHLNLPNADPEDARQEIVHCKHQLEQKLNRPVMHFSYPNGGNYAYYNQDILGMVKAAGYLTATTSNNGLAAIDQHPLELNRIRVTPNLSEIYYQIEWEPLISRRPVIIKPN